MRAPQERISSIPIYSSKSKEKCDVHRLSPPLSKKVLILAGDADGNLGDLAIVSAATDFLRTKVPNIQLAMSTSEAKRHERNLGIQPIASGWRGLITLIRAARQADLIICGGGGLFQDDDSIVKMPYWALLLTFLRLFSRPIIGLSIGAGPLDHWISRPFARLALRQLDLISVRDQLAKDVLSPLTPKNIEVVPDPAFILQSDTGSGSRAVLDASGVPLNEKPLVGVSVRRWFHKDSNWIPYKYASKIGLGRNRGNREMSKFVKLAATTLDRVITKTNAHVVFMPTYNVEHEADYEVCQNIADQMCSKQSTIIQLDDPRLYKSMTGLMSVMLCGRLHSAILAAGNGTPVVGLSYNQKFFGTFSLIGQEDRCISIEDFVARERADYLSEMLVATIRNPSRYRPDTSTVKQKTEVFIEKIAAQTLATQ